MSAGALGIATFVLPGAAAAATGGQSQVAAPSAPVTAATVAGGVVTITLATQTSEGTHSYSVWRNASSPGTEVQADEWDAAVDGGVTSFTVGGGTALDEEQPHVIVVTHTNSAGSAVSTLRLTDESTDAAASATEITYADGCGPTAVTFELTGGSGGGGGKDGETYTGGTGRGGDVIAGSLVVADGDRIRIVAGGGGTAGADGVGGSPLNGGGPGGTSELSAYDGGRGGHAGTDGTSGGGGGGGAATVLRRSRGDESLDVVAAGGGGGGGTGNGPSGSVDIDGRSASGDDVSGTSAGEQGTDVDIDTPNEPGRQDGGGGGGGGGGVAGGGGGGLQELNTSGTSYEWFGEGGRAGSSSSSDDADDVTVSSTAVSTATPSGEGGDAGSGTARWHSVTVTSTP